MLHSSDCQNAECGKDVYCEICLDFQNRRIVQIEQEIVEMVTRFAVSHPAIDSPLNLLARQRQFLQKAGGKI